MDTRGTERARLWGRVGVMASVYAVLVLSLMLHNHVRHRAEDPLNDPGLMELRARYTAQPEDPAVRQALREQDLVFRWRYFSALKFNRIGAWLLLGGLAVAAAAFKRQGALTARLPDPRERDGPVEESAAARRARRAVTAGGSVMLLGSLALLLRTPGGPHAPIDPEAVGIEEAAEATFPSPDEWRANWPAFRGAFNAGHAPAEPRPPTDWDGASGRGVIWKTPVPRAGFSSPIVWENRIFLSGGDASAREIYCFDAATGALLWQHLAANVPGSPQEAPEVTEDTGYAAATLTTDGGRVFAMFATGDLVCVDFEGRRVWARNLGVPDNSYGHASSLLMHQDLLLVQYDHGGEANLWGLRAKDGSIAWKTAREVETSWASPALIRHEGRPLVLVLAEPDLIAYDPANGAEVWRAKGVDGEIGPSPVYANGLAFVVNAYARLAALRVGAEDALVWENDEWLPNVATPVAVDPYLLVATEDAVLACFRAATGEPLWTQEFDEGFYASPIAAGGLVYALDMAGVMHILKPGETCEEIATSALGEAAVCTPAFREGRIYLRGYEHLYCIGSGEHEPG